MLRIAVAAEDQNLLDFLVPAIECIARDTVEVQLLRPFSVRGCRPRVLVEELKTLGGHPLVVVGADSKHDGKRVSVRQKARNMRTFLHIVTPEPCLAIAHPCIEAWLMHDPQAFSQGLALGLDLQFRMPRAWPSQSTEDGAKNDLGRLVSNGIGGPLPRSGFEYAREIVEEMDLLNARSDSLREWAIDLRRRMQAATSI